MKFLYHVNKNKRFLKYEFYYLNELALIAV